MVAEHLKVSLLLTGNELMSGDIVDSNSAVLAEKLGRYGCAVHYKATVGDDLSVLKNEIARIAAFSDVLIVNGGLGPTVDDLTAEALAGVLNMPLVENTEAMTQLQAWCEQKNIAFNEANRKQAILPKGVEIIPNATGSAPGFLVKVSDCEVYCTPGVPSELFCMFDEQILPRLKLQQGAALKRYRFRVFGMGESGIQQRLLKSGLKIPEGIELGFRASVPMLELKLQAIKEEDYPLLEQAARAAKDLFGAHIVTEDERTIAHVVKDILLEQGKRVTFAESCTGGLISSMMTELDGASQVFDAGFVTYSNEMKTRMLGVSGATLTEFGAVSEQVVREMLHGALENSGADLGVAVSGVAGPSGGTKDKPAGTVWVAWGSLDDIHAHCFYFPIDRKRFQVIVAALAFDLLRRELLSVADEAVYMKERALNQKREG
jgi:nicotinamide-nucleotide amidase